MFEGCYIGWVVLARTTPDFCEQTWFKQDMWWFHQQQVWLIQPKWGFKPDK
jgi:hypothetical protein